MGIVDMNLSSRHKACAKLLVRLSSINRTEILFEDQKIQDRCIVDISEDYDFDNDILSTYVK
jgi:hypothetical protein